MEQELSRPRVSPKDFFLWVGAMLTLYSSVVTLFILLFAYIDYLYPDPLSYSDPYSSTMRFAISALIVLAPTFLVLMRLIRRDAERNPEKNDLWIRRWALYFLLFVAGGAVVGDLITLLNFFLNGDVTMRFVLKVAAVFLVSGGFFMHFLADLKGYWRTYPARASWVNYGAGLVVLLVIVAGFLITGSPMTARDMRFDDQRVSDLSTIQYQITNYWQAKQKLPAALADLNDPLTGTTVPMDPATGASYRYETTGNLSFKLCATFARESTTDTRGNTSSPVYPTDGIKGNSNWNHGVGETCFDRTIDPSFYPPLTKSL